MKTKKQDGGEWYNRTCPRSVIEQAKPERRPTYGDPTQDRYVWWCCGGGNWGLDPANGVLPVSIVNRMIGTIKTVPNPPGTGGRWYMTEVDAMAALREAMDKTPEQWID